MSTSLLDQIAARKRDEVCALRAQHDLAALEQGLIPKHTDLAARIDTVRAQGRRFLIAEFKRRSPSAGAINETVPLTDQIAAYVVGGAHAVSVLTDGPGFGGSYTDLAEASRRLAGTGLLLLQKDFILDEVQIALAAAHGADLVLLIAAILSRDELVRLRRYAQTLGLDVLVELKSADDVAKVRGLDLPVVGVNHRDLDSFRLALGRSAHLRRLLPAGTRLIAESGIEQLVDLRLAAHAADGLLVGTGLMRRPELITALSSAAPLPYLFKACGVREAAHLSLPADLLGLNLSPHSRRHVAPELAATWPLPAHAVGLFYGNAPETIAPTLQQLGLRYAQVYAADLTSAQVAALPARVLLALRSTDGDLAVRAEAYAPYVDAFILDGPAPGSGEAGELPRDFPYPFLLAGGVTAETVDRVAEFSHCVGVDVASGLERENQIDPARAAAIRQALDARLTRPLFA